MVSYLFQCLQWGQILFNSQLFNKLTIYDVPKKVFCSERDYYLGASIDQLFNIQGEHFYFVRLPVTSRAMQLENYATVVSGSGTTWCLYRPAVWFLWKPLDPPPHPTLLRPKPSSVFVNINTFTKFIDVVHLSHKDFLFG